MPMRILSILLLGVLFAGCNADEIILTGEIAIRGEVEVIPKRPTVSIAAWNIRTFSDSSRDDEELMDIAHILVGYDFIAIIEIRDERVLMRTELMLQEMGRDYDYLISSEVGATQKERYAFLYDPQIVSVIEDGAVQRCLSS